jgi:hypothetical protein
MKERRTDARLLCAELVELVWKDDSGRKRKRVANLEDISLSGMCLQVEAAIPPGTAITMSYGDGEMAGIVRYCVFREGSYFLGIQLHNGSRWSSQHFRPQHLLDPRQLIDRAILRHQGDGQNATGQQRVTAK